MHINLKTSNQNLATEEPLEVLEVKQNRVFSMAIFSIIFYGLFTTSMVFVNKEVVGLGVFPDVGVLLFCE